MKKRDEKIDEEQKKRDEKRDEEQQKSNEKFRLMLTKIIKRIFFFIMNFYFNTFIFFILKKLNLNNN